MRIKSAHLRDYRIHEDTLVEFADGTTLVSGENESGKSTLAEAIRAALFVKAKGSDELHRRIIGEGAAVDLSLDVGGARPATVSKTFGTRGTTSVTVPGSATTTDDDADRALSGLLGGVKPLDRQQSADRLDRSWGHLFVVQGSSGQMPVKSLSNDVREELREALGRETGDGNVVQSAADGRVASKAEALRDELFTLRGFKTGSEPQKAEAARDEAERSRDEARRIVDERAELAVRIESAERSLAAKDREIESVRSRLDDARETLAAIRTAESELETFDRNAAAERERWDRLSGIADALAENAESAERREEEKKKLREEAKTAEDLRKSTGTLLEDAEKELQSAKGDLAKEERAAADDGLRIKEGEARLALDDAERDLRAVKELRDELDEKKKSFDACQPVDAETVKQAKEVEKDVLQEKKALDALGVRLTPAPGGDPVKADGKDLPAGEETVLAEDFTLTVGTTAVRIVLGGREGRAKRERALETARERLKIILEPFGCPDVEALERLAEVRAKAGRELETASSKLSGRLSGRSEQDFEDDAVSARQSHSACKANLDRSGLTPATNEELPGLRKRKDEADVRLEDLRDRREKAESNERIHRTNVENAQEKANEKRSGVKTAESELAKLATARSTLLRDWSGKGGEDGFRAELEAARIREEERIGERESLVKALEALAPDDIRENAKTLEDNLSALRTERNGLQSRLDKSRGAMMAGEGATDPNAALRDAEAALDRAEEAFGVQRRRAEAVRLLADTFAEVRAEADRNLAGPLAEKAKPYLEILFGRDSGVSLKGIADGEPELVLDRTGKSFGFGVLSGGTAEQVSVALRLAMAEVLAGNFGGTLPMVLDDAFANSDEGRLDKVSRMLNTAREHGLQIIVLTCDPARYACLRADKRIQLENGRVV